MAEYFLDLLGELLAILVDQDLYSSIVHADLSSVSFQFLLCYIDVFLAFANEELTNSLVILCLCGYERDCLLVMFGELHYSFVYFLSPSVLLSFPIDDVLYLQFVIRIGN